MKVYRVERKQGSVIATVNDQPLQHVTYHGDGSFEFGNASKPAQDLALSILADFYEEYPTPEQLHHGTAMCWPHHQKFTWRFIAMPTENITGNIFEVTEDEIRVWLTASQK